MSKSKIKHKKSKIQDAYKEQEVYGQVDEYMRAPKKKKKNIKVVKRDNE